MVAEIALSLLLHGKSIMCAGLKYSVLYRVLMPYINLSQIRIQRINYSKSLNILSTEPVFLYQLLN